MTPFPRIAAVKADLQGLFDLGLAHGDEPLEIRLQVYPDGTWAVRFGDPGFDLDHHGFWGLGEMAPDTDLAELAADLVEQAKTHAFEASFEVSP